MLSRSQVVLPYAWLLLLPLLACAKPSSSWDPRRERQEAAAFAERVNELSRAGRSAELSGLLDPNPHCGDQGCILRGLTRETACEGAARGPLELDAGSIELFEHGDGFSVQAKVIPESGKPCRLKLEANRRDGTGPFYFPVLPPQP